MTTQTLTHTHTASQSGHVDVVKQLVSVGGAELMLLPHCNGSTSLLVAALHGNACVRAWETQRPLPQKLAGQICLGVGTYVAYTYEHAWIHMCMQVTGT